MVGFCKADVKPLGPLHAYVAPVTAVLLRLMVFPWQTGELELTVGATGVAFTVTAVEATADVHPLTATYKVYVPDIAVVADVRTGSSKLEVKPPGPVQK